MEKRLKEILEKSKGGPVLKKVTVGGTPPKRRLPDMEMIWEAGKELEKRLRDRPYLGGRR